MAPVHPVEIRERLPGYGSGSASGTGIEKLRHGSFTRGSIPKWFPAAADSRSPEDCVSEGT